MLGKGTVYEAQGHCATAAGKVGDRGRGWMLFCGFKLGVNVFSGELWLFISLFIAAQI